MPYTPRACSRSEQVWDVMESGVRYSTRQLAELSGLTMTQAYSAINYMPLERYQNPDSLNWVYWRNY